MYCTYADGVAFPEDVLADEEEIVLHVRPHWKAVVLPALVLVLALSGLVMGLVLLPATDGGRIGLLMVAAIMLYYGGRYGVHPLLDWRCTEYVLTGERLLMQRGIVDRERRDLPLNRINDHAMKQSLLDRVFGSGTLTIDSIGDQRAVLAGVPAAQLVQSTLYELIELAPAREAEEEEEEDQPQRGSSSGRRSR
ncbi:PH (Pleckstrin Homology) domain-containing protein [Actinoplanes xinjiangensis]|uniref:PH (Pleckstrin Homology) domain-containing protein n=1 Tax=Actinoplanes xinjiangensis TaxID=512350 RepID=A0A316EQM5_9ACTN|nr:PH (Pleckstrin Homology) domain-containing protein [Actinoplanes xinjiangensis]GIF43106.1 membrane protein [Actinoplanes xinjiangensis]